MKFALVDGQRQEPQPKLSGECPYCGRPVVARCGKVRIKHWAHRGGVPCDSSKEGETEWHRNWKNQFPTEWQEVVHYSGSGEKHIADIKTDLGCVIEFQHSQIKPEERQSREAFYENLIWVVDGRRRLNDKNQFFGSLGNRSDESWPEIRIGIPDGSLFRDWIESSSLILFDFGHDHLWLLFPESNVAWAYVLPLHRSVFIDAYRSPGSNASLTLQGLMSRFKLFFEEYSLRKRPVLNFKDIPDK